jgi:hypothetical protein
VYAILALDNLESIIDSQLENFEVPLTPADRAKIEEAVASITDRMHTLAGRRTLDAWASNDFSTMMQEERRSR